MKIEGGSEIEANVGSDGAEETKESSDTKPAEGDKTGLKMEEDKNLAEPSGDSKSVESAGVKDQENAMPESNGTNKVAKEQEEVSESAPEEQKPHADSSVAAQNGGTASSEVTDKSSEAPGEPEAPLQDNAQTETDVVPTNDHATAAAASESAEDSTSCAESQISTLPPEEIAASKPECSQQIEVPESAAVKPEDSAKADVPDVKIDSHVSETKTSEEVAGEPLAESKTDEKASDQSEETERETRSGLRRGRSSQREEEAARAAKDSESEAERDESSERRRSGSRRKKEKVVVNSKCILDAAPITDGPLKTDSVNTPEKSKRAEKSSVSKSSQEREVDAVSKDPGEDDSTNSDDNAPLVTKKPARGNNRKSKEASNNSKVEKKTRGSSNSAKNSPRKAAEKSSDQEEASGKSPKEAVVEATAEKATENQDATKPEEDSQSNAEETEASLNGDSVGKSCEPSESAVELEPSTEESPSAENPEEKSSTESTKKVSPEVPKEPAKSKKDSPAAVKESPSKRPERKRKCKDMSEKLDIDDSLEEALDAAEAAEAAQAAEAAEDPSSSILFQRLSSSSHEEDSLQTTTVKVKEGESENDLDAEFDEEDSFEEGNSEDDESRLIIDEGRSASRSRSANSNELKVAKAKEETDLEPGEVPPSQVNSEVKTEVKSEFDFEDDDFETKPAGETDPPVKKRRKHNRFNGMSEEEVAKKKLPDVIKPDLDILIVGINPGMYAAFKGHHYAGPGNHFWRCMFLSGLLPRAMSAEDDQKCLNFGIGFTNIVERTTRGSANLTKEEIEEGTKVLQAKVKEFKPKIAVFNGKGIYEIFSGNKEFHLGKQPDKVEGTDTHVWVMPNSSARCAQLPRAVDKVPFYSALKKFRDHLKGEIEHLDEEEVVFKDIKLKNFNEGASKKLQKELQLKAESGEITPTGSVSSEGVKMEAGSGGEGGDMRIDPATGKKRRGRPPKPRPDGTVPPPKRRILDEHGNPIPRGTNPIDPLTGKKKRGRPKKADMPPGYVPPPKKPKKVKDKGVKNEEGSQSQINQPPPPLSGVNATSNKPTKIVPPLPPFSPNFGHGSAAPGGPPQGHQPEEMPSDLKKEKMSKKGFFDPSATQPHPASMGGRQPHGHQPPVNYPSENYGHQQMQQHNVMSSSGYHYPPADHDPQAPPSGYPPGYPNQSGIAPNNHVPPPPQQRPEPQQQQQQQKSGNRHHDVTTKSITGLESLVDQIPSLGPGGAPPPGAAAAESDSSGVYSAAGSSHPNTPRSVGPYSPAAGSYPPTSSFHTPTSQQGGGFPSSYTPADMENASSYAGSPAPTATSQAPPTDFSVSSLVTGNSNASNAPSDPFSVSSLTAASSAAEMAKYSSGLPTPPPPHGSSAAAQAAATAAAASTNPYMFQSYPAGFLGNSASAYAAHAAQAMNPMAYYGHHPHGYGSNAAQNAAYGSSFAAASASNPYANLAHAHHAAAAASNPHGHGLHMPNPSYPYPSPYGQNPYSQSPFY